MSDLTPETNGEVKPEEVKNPLHGNVAGAREAQIRDRERQILELRAAHVPGYQIARMFEISESMVSKIVHRAMRNAVAVPAGELLADYLLQIDRHLQALARPALGLPRREGEEPPTLAEQVRASEAAGHWLERRYRLQGLDKLTIQVSDVTQEERAAALADQLRAYLQGREDGGAEAAQEAPEPPDGPPALEEPVPAGEAV